MRAALRRLQALLAPVAEGDGLVAAAPRVPLRVVARRLVPLARPYRAPIVLLLAVAVALPAVETIEIWLFQRVVDDVLVPVNLQPMVLLGLLYLGLSLTSGLLSWVDDVVSTRVGEGLSLSVRRQMLAHLHQVPTDVADRSRLGDLLSRMTSDVRSIETLILATLVDGVGTVARLIFFTGALLVLDWQLALVSFVVAPVLWWVGHRFAVRMKRAAKEARRRAGSMTAVAEESLSNLALVQVHGRGEDEQARFDREGRAILAAQMRTARLRATYPVVVDLLELVALLLVIGLGVWALADQRLTLGGLLVFLTYLAQLYRPIREIAELAADLASATAGAERVFEVLDLPPGVPERAGAVAPTHVHGILEMEEVSYRYPGTVEPVLRGARLRLQPGRLTVLTGPSGSGKSTMVRLLSRLGDPDIGAVRLDGHDLRHLPLRTVREHVVVLLQDAPVLDATVRDNVRFARPDATDAEVWQALEAADVAEVVASLPEGLDTRLRQRGRVLSGGQRQRIALARALLLDAPVLVLDEPTAAVDAAASRRLMATLRRLAQDRAVLVASHDPAVLAAADEAVALIDGRLTPVPLTPDPQHDPEEAPGRSLSGATTADPTPAPAPNATSAP